MIYELYLSPLGQGADPEDVRWYKVGGVQAGDMAVIVRYGSVAPEWRATWFSKRGEERELRDVHGDFSSADEAVAALEDAMNGIPRSAQPSMWFHERPQ
jgi:hypothetical protein